MQNSEIQRRIWQAWQLGPTRRLVGLFVAAECDRNNGTAELTTFEIADSTGLCKRTVVRSLHELVKGGYVGRTVMRGYPSTFRMFPSSTGSARP